MRVVFLAGDVLPRCIPALVAVLALVLASACGARPENAADQVCAGLETVADRSGLISRSKAEQLAPEWLASSAPEVTEVEVERVVGSCLTTFRSYQRDLLEGRVWTSPGVRSPDTPVWIVEVKGISRPAGISAANADNPYRYAMDVLNATTGESIAGSRYRESMLEPAEE